MPDHIEIVREDTSAAYRFRSNPNAPRPQNRERSIHGPALKEQLEQALSSVSEKRRDHGVDTDKLLVVQIMGDALPQDALERMLSRFRMWLVEEVPISRTNSTKLVVQFEDSAAIAAFEEERAMWERDDPSEGALTYAQRRGLFACIEAIRRVSREDRYGPRLKRLFSARDPLPPGMFLVNVDIWYSGDRRTIAETERQIKMALGTGDSRLLGDLFELPSLLLGRALVNEFTLNALLDMDIVAQVDLPMGAAGFEQCDLYSTDFPVAVQDTLDDRAPLATVLDSGVFAGHPLLSSVVVAEEDFDLTESSTSDQNGHGTAVAGIVAYGGFANREDTRHVFKPLVRICNGKVMHDERGFPCYPPDRRPEQIVKEAIEFFHREYGCRVFNLSSGDVDYVYDGGRQMPWAELIDKIVRELNIIVVVSAGNVSNACIPAFSTRNELMEKCRDQLFSPDHRLIDPATTALGITVGSITRYSEPEPARTTRLSVGEQDYMSVFTRVGRGVAGAVKPEFVDYGGNYSLHQISRGESRWYKRDRALMEPTLNNTLDKVFKGFNGTSFAAPHLTHLASRIERTLEEQLGEPPSANLIRAFLAASARYPKAMREWADSSVDPSHRGPTIPRQDQRLRLVGYGKVDERILISGTHCVTLFAEDALPLRSLHLYKIPTPVEFLEVRGNKRITIGFAYDPPTRLSRRAYIANSLWVEVFRRTDESDLLSFITKIREGDDAEVEAFFKEFRKTYGAQFYPGSTEIQDSTLQQRVWEKGSQGGRDLVWPGNEPYIYLLVTGKEKFRHPEHETPQRYALAINFSYDADADIELYQRLSDRARLRNRERVRQRTLVQI